MAVLKVAVEEQFGIPFSKQELNLDGKVLADPFSLSDLPIFSEKKVNFVHVKVFF